MPKQPAITGLRDAMKKKVTWREQFLAEMDAVVPWGRLQALIEPNYPKAGPKGGRPPMPLETLLRIYFLQNWYALSDPMAEETLYVSEAMRRFAGIELGDDRIPDETTTLNFRHLLEHHGLTEAIFADVNVHLADEGITLRSGTLVDATTAKVHDSRVWDELLHGEETSVWADKGYVSAEREAAFSKDGKVWGVMRKAPKGGKLDPIDEEINRVIAKVRARVEHPFRVIKRQFGHLKTRYRALVDRLLRQKPKDKGKLYALHEPQVGCISKGKARVRYEFGTKVSVATTHKEGFVVGMRSMPGNPYDGHTLREALEQVEILTNTRPKRAFVDRGYRGHGVQTTAVYIAGSRRGTTSALRRDLRRRSAIEPMIGHMKTDGRLARCALKGTLGDALHTVLRGCGHNIRMILAHLRALWAEILAVLMVIFGAASAARCSKSGLRTVAA